MKAPHQVQLDNVGAPNDAAVVVVVPDEASAPVPFRKLFQFANCTEWTLMIFGSIGGVLNGLSLPLFSVLFGDLFESLGGSSTVSKDEGFAQISRTALQITLVGVLSLVASFVQVACWAWAAETQTGRIRELYLRSVLRQEIAWHDTREAGQLSGRLGTDITQIRSAIDQNVGNLFQFGAMFIGGLAVGFYQGWQLTLVILAGVPLLAGAAALFGKSMSTDNSVQMDAYNVAGAVAEEVLRSIRTVTMFAGQKAELARYTKSLAVARDTGIHRGRMVGMSIGAMWGTMFIMYGGALWYGGHLVAQGTYRPRQVLSVFFSVLLGAFGLGQAGPSLTAIATGMGAAAAVWSIIDRKSAIDSLSVGTRDQKLPVPVKGEIVFQNVHFSYPGRPDVKVLNDVSFVIKPGTTLALVGETGCGKSTIGQLINRFYEPTSGVITLDGIDIRQLNVTSLRECIGVVFQQPNLFTGTVADNIRFGKAAATLSEIENACRAAHCEEFINNLPDKYETSLGGDGNEKLSGGQKQRVAIARAIIKNPTILLLDEATSALDSTSERIVQQALDAMTKSRTTIAIAHRLSTIRHANQICLLKKGVIAERGTYDELVQLGGDFAKLLRSTSLEAADSETAIESNTETDSVPLTDIVIHNVVGKVPKEAISSETSSVPNVNFKSRLWALSKNDWPALVIGCTSSVAVGLVMPSFAFFLSEMLAAFFKPDIEKACRLWALLFFGLAAWQLVFCLITHSSLAVVAENLTLSIRIALFKTFLRQDIGWFDVPENSPGILNITYLGSHCEAVRGLTVSSLSPLIQTVTMFAAGMTIAFIYGWRLALILLAVFPIVAAAGAAQLAFIGGNSGKSEFASAGRLANEAIGSIRTVAALSAETHVIAEFRSEVTKLISIGCKTAIATGLSFGFSQFVMFACYGVAFYYGGYLIREGLMTNPLDTFKVFFAVIMSSMGVGQVMQMSPDVAKAQQAALQIFSILDRIPPIDSESTSGKQKSLEGKLIAFNDVDFSYPTRMDSQVLNKFTVVCPAGKTIAFVGHSGSGKTSTTNLISRFYNYQGGTIRIGDDDLMDLNVANVRSQIGLVSQEPVLFSSTIGENIRYGKPDATKDQILEAAKQANAMEFISRMPLGLDTPIGPRGTLLSGGQRQRLAIARAILIDPKILLLDEATSALDNESEAQVQVALDQLMLGRTSIVVAHRLSTIRKAHTIAVIDHGVVVEKGTHAELIGLKGVYYHLAGLQDTKTSASV